MNSVGIPAPGSAQARIQGQQLCKSGVIACWWSTGPWPSQHIILICQKIQKYAKAHRNVPAVSVVSGVSARSGDTNELGWAEVCRRAACRLCYRRCSHCRKSSAEVWSYTALQRQATSSVRLRYASGDRIQTLSKLVFQTRHHCSSSPGLTTSTLCPFKVLGMLSIDSKQSSNKKQPWPTQSRLHCSSPLQFALCVHESVTTAMTFSAPSVAQRRTPTFGSGIIHQLCRTLLPQGQLHGSYPAVAAATDSLGGGHRRADSLLV